MKSDDYVKYLTEEMLKYMHMTKEEKQQRKAAKPSKKSTSYWFGLVPLALKMWRRNRKKHNY
ncbi:YqzE family protein [Halobacillus salinarum]|uniref:YqzE family protein n=1 Tax=Halobacillus salinarum TaxID=2932257 RepID=A0ABY4EEQ9_9BACI|nr:YqzE family protein [Halobacillus salinarum]UOQ42538.1 YqzE family protein [Halobacillus salinarum]